jgi:hypothetical protein
VIYSLPHDTVIHIQWQGPFSYEEAVRFTDRRTDYGVYQFRGPHTAYGPDALLYVGRAQKQTFGARLPQEGWEGWQVNNGSVRVHVGRLHGGLTPDNETWNRQIEWAERLLILAHRPAHNASGIYRNDDPALRVAHVLNWGDRGHLLPEVSGARWSSLYYGLPGYAPYGAHALTDGGATDSGS